LVHLLALEAKHARQARAADVDIQEADLVRNSTSALLLHGDALTHLVARLG
jgi:hypothetical protein